jgi:hypothetical protein
MRARAVAVSAALLLLGSVTSGAAAADQGGRLASSPADLVGAPPATVGALLSGEQLAPGGPAQGNWFTEYISGGFGSNYLGPGGWRSSQPFYGPFGPYPTPQTAALFGATNSPFDPYTTLLLSHSGFGANNQFTGLAALQNNGPLANINRTGLAPLLGFNLNTLQRLGIGTLGPNAFSIAGQNFPFATANDPNVLSLAALFGANIPPGFFLPTTGAQFGTGVGQ